LDRSRIRSRKLPTRQAQARAQAHPQKTSLPAVAAATIYLLQTPILTFRATHLCPLLRPFLLLSPAAITGTTRGLLPVIKGTAFHREIFRFMLLSWPPTTKDPTLLLEITRLILLLFPQTTTPTATDLPPTTKDSTISMEITRLTLLLSPPAVTSTAGGLLLPTINNTTFHREIIRSMLLS